MLNPCLKFAVIVFVAALLFNTSEVVAEDDKSYLLTQETYEVLNLAREAMEDEKYQTAIQKLDSYLSKDSIKTYDTAVIHQTLAYAYNLLGNYKSAIAEFKKATSAEALPDKVTHEINYNIAQLLIQTEEYQQGLSYLEKWFEKESQPSADAHLLAATAYYRINKFKQLIPHAQNAIKISNSPQQSWYELLLTGYYESKQFSNAAQLLVTMISKYPDNDNYWLQLASIYQLDEKYEKSLAISELAYEKGLLESDDILQLAQTYLYMELPLKAATLLNAELESGNIPPEKDNIELLANSWLLAKEPKQAAMLLERFVKRFNNASLYYKLGQIYIELEDWDKAGPALESAVANADPGNKREAQSNAWLLLGIASFHKKDLNRSTKALEKAFDFKETREQAKWWLDQITEVSSKVSEQTSKSRNPG